MRGESAEQASQSQRAHITIEEPATAKSVSILEAESDPDEDEMVTRRALTIGHFVPST